MPADPFAGFAERHNAFPHAHCLHSKDTVAHVPKLLAIIVKYDGKLSRCVALKREHKHFDLVPGEVLVGTVRDGSVFVTCAPQDDAGLRASHFSFTGGKWCPTQAVSPGSGYYDSLPEVVSASEADLFREVSEYLVKNGLTDKLGLCFAYKIPGQRFHEVTDEVKRQQCITLGSPSNIASEVLETYWEFDKVKRREVDLFFKLALQLLSANSTSVLTGGRLCEMQCLHSHWQWWRWWQGRWWWRRGHQKVFAGL